MSSDNPLASLFARVEAAHCKQEIEAASAWERVGSWLDGLDGEGLFCLGQIVGADKAEMFIGQILAIARAKGVDPSTGEPVTASLKRREAAT